MEIFKPRSSGTTTAALARVRQKMEIFKARSAGISSVDHTTMGEGWIDAYFYGEKKKYRDFLKDSGLLNEWRESQKRLETQRC